MNSMNSLVATSTWTTAPQFFTMDSSTFTIIKIIIIIIMIMIIVIIIIKIIIIIKNGTKIHVERFLNQSLTISEILIPHRYFLKDQKNLREIKEDIKIN